MGVFQVEIIEWQMEFEFIEKMKSIENGKNWGKLYYFYI